MSIIRWNTKKQWEDNIESSNIDTYSYPDYLSCLTLSDNFNSNEINPRKWSFTTHNVVYSVGSGLYLSSIDDNGYFRLISKNVIPQIFNIEIKLSDKSPETGIKILLSARDRLYNDFVLLIQNNEVIINNDTDNPITIGEYDTICLVRYSKNLYIYLRNGNDITEIGTFLPTAWDFILYLETRLPLSGNSVTINEININGRNDSYAYDAERPVTNSVISDYFNDGYIDSKWIVSNSGNVIETTDGIVMQSGEYIYQNLNDIDIPLYIFHKIISIEGSDYEFYLHATDRTYSSNVGFRLVRNNYNINVYNLDTNYPTGTLTFSGTTTDTLLRFKINGPDIYIFDSTNNYIGHGSISNIDNRRITEIGFISLSDNNIIKKFDWFPSTSVFNTISVESFNNQIWESYMVNDIIDKLPNNITFNADDSSVVMTAPNTGTYWRDIRLYYSAFTNTKWESPILKSMDIKLSFEMLNNGDYFILYHSIYSPNYNNRLQFTVYRSDPQYKIRINYYDGIDDRYYYRYIDTNNIIIHTEFGPDTSGASYPNYMAYTIYDFAYNELHSDRFLTKGSYDSFTECDYYINVLNTKTVEAKILEINPSYTMTLPTANNVTVHIDPQTRDEIGPSYSIYKFRSNTIPKRFSMIYTKNEDEMVYVLFSADGETWYGPYGEYSDDTNNVYTNSSEITYLPKSDNNEYYYIVNMIPSKYIGNNINVNFSRYLRSAFKLKEIIASSSYVSNNVLQNIKVVNSNYLRLGSTLPINIAYSTYRIDNAYISISKSDKYVWFNNIELEDDELTVYTINATDATSIGIYSSYAGRMIFTIDNTDYYIIPNVLNVFNLDNAHNITLKVIGLTKISTLGVFALWQ